MPALPSERIGWLRAVVGAWDAGAPETVERAAGVSDEWIFALLGFVTGDEHGAKQVDKWVKEYKKHPEFGYIFRENARDVREIEEYMDKHRDAVHTRERVNNRCYATSKFPAWRRKPHQEVLKEPKDYGYKSVLHMNRLSSDNAMVPYKDLDDAALTALHDRALVGAARRHAARRAPQGL